MKNDAPVPPVTRIALLQRASSGDSVANLRAALAGIEEAADQGARLVCLQELFQTPYFPQAEDAEFFDLAEPIPGPTTERLGAAARHHEVFVVGSVFERRGAGLYSNTAILVGPKGDLVGLYRKMHIPHDPGFREKYYFTPGDTGFVACPTSVGCVAPLVCWDQWFPEAARAVTLRGAQLLVYPTAIGWDVGEKPEVQAAEVDAWETVQRSHAITNGVFVAAVNRVGVEDRLEFWGGSMVCDPWGRVLARAGRGEETLVVDCDLREIEAARRVWPFLRDRRIDAYGSLLERWSDPSQRA